MDTRVVAASALCATLYAVVGYMSYLGIFTPVIGVVRFWPSVFIPATFAIIYGPMVGGLGAAIGIFISDMLIHGNALLSLSVGVPANFIGFYTVGYLASKLKGKSSSVVWALMVSAKLLCIALVVYVASWILKLISLGVAVAYIIGIAVSLAAVIAYSIVNRRTLYTPLIVFACSSGLLVGSVIIGIGVWLFSQYFILPGGGRALPVDAILLWTLWVYVTEIPFMVWLTPITVHIAMRMGLKTVLGAS